MSSNYNIDQNKLSRQLIVIGNGFDLQCNLQTKYQDFFDYRFGITLQDEINYHLNINTDARKAFHDALSKELYPYFKKIIDSLPPRGLLGGFKQLSKIKEVDELQVVTKTQSFIKGYLQQIKEQITSKINNQSKDKFLSKLDDISSIAYSKWDTIFLLANCFFAENSIIQWNDVENIIFKVVSIILMNNRKNIEIRDLKFNTESSKYYFIFGVKDCFNANKNEVALSMLNYLRIFEDNFADYINKIKEESQSFYYLNSFELLIELMHVQKNNILDVLSFNYSLDKSCLDGLRGYFDDRFDNQNKLTINSWSNIHGIAAYKDNTTKSYILAQSIKTVGKDIQLPAPIFGIDNHDILNPDENGNINFNDPRSIFTKSFRLLDNHVNNIRTHTFQDNVDVITFFGHSLSQADYSYFESIFDQYDVYHSNVKLEFYYYPANDDITAKNNERKTMRNVVNLLTSYGATLKNEHGENIVNKLILEQRLNVLPNPKISIPDSLKNSLF